MTLLNILSANRSNHCRGIAGKLLAIALFLTAVGPTSFTHAQQSATGFQQTTNRVQPAMVKIVGSGGFQGLEPYQSGFLISSSGHILTVWSYVLDSDVVTVTLNDGQRYDAKLVGYDPKLEIAVLKIEATGLSNFNLDESVPATAGSKILAFQSLYQGDVYILDAVTNNPGAAGGAITDRKGRLIGMIGKELRDSRTNSWLNFAIPIDQVSKSVDEIRSGKKVVQTESKRRKPSEPMTPELMGIVLVPKVVSRTPPYIDRVIPGSAADRAGLLIDDLVIEVNGRMTPSSIEVDQALEYIDRDSKLNLTIQRGRKFKSFEMRLAK